MDYPWIMHGICMDYGRKRQRPILGSVTFWREEAEAPQIMHGLCMDYVWIMYGLRMGYM